MPSSVIKSYRYDESRKRLEVIFVSGRRYAYADVSRQIFDGLQASSSKGEFFNGHIRGHYLFERIERD